MELAEQAVSLLVVFGLLAGAVWAFGRKKRPSLFNWRKLRTGNGALEIADRLTLTPQHILHLVRVGDRTLLVATHPHGVTFDPGSTAFSMDLRSAMSAAVEGRQ